MSVIVKESCSQNEPGLGKVVHRIKIQVQSMEFGDSQPLPFWDERSFAV